MSRSRLASPPLIAPSSVASLATTLSKPIATATGVATAVSIVLLIAASLLVSRSAAADPHVKDCDALAEQYAPQARGWRLRCVDALPADWLAAAPTADGASAMTHRAERTILVVRGQRAAYTEASIAHELAHAESADWPPELRIAFARAVGAQTWWTSDPFTAPIEVFAESSVRCRGLPTNLRFPVVPCDLVEAARAEGGASTPLQKIR